MQAINCLTVLWATGSKQAKNNMSQMCVFMRVSFVYLWQQTEVRDR